MTDKRPFPLPTGYFAIPLGLGALSLAWLHMGDTLSFSRNVSDIIGVTSVSVWALFVLLYIYKMIYFSHEVRDEYCCPIRFSFLALIPITTMLSGDILYRWLPLIGEGLIWIGTIGQLLFASVRISALWKDGTFEEKSTLPPFYLPSVATNFTSASSLALLGYQDLGYLFLGAGMIAWIIYEPCYSNVYACCKLNLNFVQPWGSFSPQHSWDPRRIYRLMGERSIFSLSSYGDTVFYKCSF